MDGSPLTTLHSVPNDSFIGTSRIFSRQNTTYSPVRALIIDNYTSSYTVIQNTQNISQVCSLGRQQQRILIYHKGNWAYF